MTHLRSREHLRTVLGRFALTSYTIEVYTEGHAGPGQISHTLVHEQTHQKLVLSTTFGALQLLLGLAVEQPGAGLPEWGRQAGALLADSVDGSWTAHEGYAVYSEFELGPLLGHREPPAALPDDYAAAYAVYRRVAERLPAALRPLAVFVMDGVAQAAFNGEILAAWALEGGSGAEPGALLADPLHRPDDRLRRLAAALVLEGDDERRLDAAARRLAAEHGLPGGTPLEDVAAAAWAAGNGALRDALLDAAGAVVADAAARCCPELTVLPPERARRDVAAFLAAGRTRLAPYGVEVPPYVLAGEADPMELGEVHLLGRGFDRTIVPVDAFRQTMRQALRPGTPFVLQVGGHPWDPPARQAFFAHAFGHARAGADGSVVGVGEWEEVADAAQACAAESGVLLVVDASVAHPFRGALWGPVVELAHRMGQDLLVVAPSTMGTDVRDLLQGLRAVGVVRLFEVAFLTGMRAYFAATPTGLTVLFPIPFTVAGRLEAHHPELAAWFVSTLGVGVPADEGSAEVERLRIFASLLLQGALTLTRPSWSPLRPAG
jgi:hypothetical protein